MLSFTEFITEHAMSADPTQPWSVAGSLHDIYYKAVEMAQGAKPRLEQVLKRAASGRGKIKVGIKSYDSFLSKVNRNNAPNKVHDMLRSALLLDTQEDVEAAVKLLKRTQTVHSIEHKDKGSDPTYGYFGSWHLKLVINGIIAEVQVMTRRLWTYKDWAHDFYKMYRDKGDITPQAARLSKQIFAMGNTRPVRA